MKPRALMTSLLFAALFVWQGGISRSEVLSNSATALDARQARVAETTIGNLVADAARAALQAEVALIEASQFRLELIPAGPVCSEALTSVLLYPDEKVILTEISGEKLLAALERSLSALPLPSTSFLQVSGVKVTFRSANSSGERVETLLVGGKEVEPAKVYRVAMTLSLSKGALGYFRVFNQLTPKKTGPSLSEAVCQYVSKQTALSYKLEGRLRDLSQQES